MSNKDEIIALLQQLGDTKQYMVDDLVAKGEEASIKDSFDALAQKSADYIPKTYILVDEEGNEIPATLVEQETVFDATENDVRLGKVFATSTGVKTGTKVIPSYHTTQGYQIIPNGNALQIASLNTSDLYDYTKLQVIVCDFNTTLKNSVSASGVVIDDNLYAVGSTEPLSTILKNQADKTIEFGTINETGQPQILRYFTYKEID